MHPVHISNGLFHLKYTLCQNLTQHQLEFNPIWANNIHLFQLELMQQIISPGWRLVDFKWNSPIIAGLSLGSYTCSELKLTWASYQQNSNVHFTSKYFVLSVNSACLVYWIIVTLSVMQGMGSLPQGPLPEGSFYCNIKVKWYQRKKQRKGKRGTRPNTITNSFIPIKEKQCGKH